MPSAPEIACKVRRDHECACAHCEGAHGYRRSRQPLAVWFAGSGATAKSVCSSVSLGY